jgi:hypothetical protein
MNSYYEAQRADYARFLGTTPEHRMTIHKDDGLYRHIHVGKPGSSNRHFNITTVPGYLFFTGDMGCYTFTRERDMFGFFNSVSWDRETPIINYRYWAEKCHAIDRYGELTRFDDDDFRRTLIQVWREYHRKSDLIHDLTKHERSDLHYAFWYEVLGELTSDDERGNLELVVNWQHYIRGEYISPFEEFYEYGPFKTHTETFRWVCWAIARTVRDYFRGGDRVQRQEAHDKLILSGQL